MLHEISKINLIRNKPVLVTGGWGMLGKALRQELAGQGFTNVLSPRRAELDLLDAPATFAYLRQHRPIYVFHLASVVFGLLGNLRNQVKAISENTLLNHNVLMACAEAGVAKLFFAGTVASYPFPFPALPLTEDMLWQGVPHGGEFGYASAKRHALSYLQILKQETGLDFFYGLFTNLYGPEDRFDDQNGHVIPSLIKKMDVACTTGGDFPVWGDGSATRDFMYVEDAARAVLAGFGTLSGVANICSGQSISIRQTVEALVKAAAFQSEVIWQVDKPVGVPVRSVSDVVLRSLGFTPAVNIEDGMKRSWAWYQAHRETSRS
jgi:GDP-L-fucose synthase